MLSPDYPREPRDFAKHLAAVTATESANTFVAADDITAPLALHSTHTALAEVPMFHQHAQVRADSLHLLDGGGTMRHLILLGNWLYSKGKDMLALANERLAAMPRLDDFTHFSHPLWGLEDGNAALRKVKMAANLRCVEYEQLVSQMMYSSSSYICIL